MKRSTVPINEIDLLEDPQEHYPEEWLVPENKLSSEGELKGETDSSYSELYLELADKNDPKKLAGKVGTISHINFGPSGALNQLLSQQYPFLGQQKNISMTISEPVQNLLLNFIHAQKKLEFRIEHHKDGCDTITQSGIGYLTEIENIDLTGHELKIEMVIDHMNQT